MKLRIVAAVAVVASMAASSAGAVVAYDHKNPNQLFALDEGVFLKDFDAISNANVSYSGGNIQTFEDPIVDSAAPPWTGPGSETICCAGSDEFEADPTTYASVQGGQTATFSALNGFYFTSFSFYMGSPDSYNTVTFNYVGGAPATVLSGTQIWGGSPLGDGTRTAGYRVYYDFGGSKVSSITFASGQNAFEFDGLAGSLAVPEPGTWALMIMGFGGAGAMVRANRRRAAAALA